ncbi:MAG TPA: site-specific DNA-methyltransferase [Candidatus Binataceae bacterium]|nr:site-specific DNA-methyltransferase [Candidatus Binataceae bacterium]
MKKSPPNVPLSLLKENPLYATGLGAAYVGDSRLLLRELPDASVNLVITSPPFALHFKKEYGNKDQPDYIPWFLEFAREVKRVLAEDGSFVVDLGGAYEPGRPTRSLYHFKLLISLVEDLDLFLAQEFYWHNPGKMPAPAEWVTVRRIRVKDSVNCLWWLSKTPNPKADNRKILVPYSRDMERLIRKGYRAKQRPSGHNITEKWGRDHGGAICSNLIVQGNNDSNGSYLKLCEQAGLKPHPARFPPQLPELFINFLTNEGDLVVDIFAGSNTTGAACDQLRRRWLAFELESRYLEAGKLRFPKLAGEFGVADSRQPALDGQFSLPLLRK